LAYFLESFIATVEFYETLNIFIKTQNFMKIVNVSVLTITE